jgi:hypothetical protein
MSEEHNSTWDAALDAPGSDDEIRLGLSELGADTRTAG